MDRTQRLADIIRRLHDGAEVSEVKADFDALAEGLESSEIAAMEQQLISEGMPPSEVQRLCDVHVAVVKDALQDANEPELPEEHPVAAFLAENRVLEDLLAELRGAHQSLADAADDAAAAAAMATISQGLAQLADIAIHYARKENQIFPMLEKHGIDGPTKVMWGVDDDIRTKIAEVRAIDGRGDATTLAESLPEMLRMVEDMIYKEEKILFPTALKTFSGDEWAEIAAGDAEIGYAWIEPPSLAAVAERATPADTTDIPLTTGALSLEQLDLIVRTIPFDLTFVDENDRVRFYSEGERVFPRSPGVIGREVTNCHPPKSVDKVEAILAEFKVGTQDVAEFWIELAGRFVHIRYFAVRDAGGEYRGCLEVVQDATHVRGLSGQRRLLDW